MLCPGPHMREWIMSICFIICDVNLHCWEWSYYFLQGFSTVKFLFFPLSLITNLEEIPWNFIKFLFLFNHSWLILVFPINFVRSKASGAVSFIHSFTHISMSSWIYILFHSYILIHPPPPIVPPLDFGKSSQLFPMHFLHAIALISNTKRYTRLIWCFLSPWPEINYILWYLGSFY